MPVLPRTFKLNTNIISEYWRHALKGENINDCWKWLGSLVQGYPYFCIDYQYYRGHIVSYMIYNKLEISPELLVCHNCPNGDNRYCTNPQHLWLGTTEDNIIDSYYKGTHIALRGENHPSCKLTTEEIDRIKYLYSLGWKQSTIAKDFKINQCHVSRIINELRRKRG